MCVCVYMLTCLRTAMFSQRAYKVNNLPSVTQEELWPGNLLLLTFLIWGASEIHIPCWCSLDVWIYDSTVRRHMCWTVSVPEHKVRKTAQ